MEDLMSKKKGQLKNTKVENIVYFNEALYNRPTPIVYIESTLSDMQKKQLKALRVNLSSTYQ